MFALWQPIVLLTGCALCGGLGYKFGHDGAAAQCLETNLDTAVKYARGWQDEVERRDKAAQEQTARAVEHAQRAANVKAGQVRERNEYALAYRNLAAALGTDRVACDTPDDTFRLLNTAIDRANGSLPGRTTSGVPPVVPIDTEATDQ